MSAPIARPEGTRTQGRKAARLLASRDFSPPKDPAPAPSLPTRPSRLAPYITLDRLHRIASQMERLDWQILNFVSACRLADGPQLVRHFWHTADRDTTTARAGRRALRWLAQWRVLDPLPRRIGSRKGGSERTVYSVGRAGARLLRQRGYTGPRIEAPGALYVAHTLAATELVVSLHEADRAGQIECIEVQSEPECWRGFIGPGVSRVVLKPDLYVRVGAGHASEDRWMVEVDLATEASGTLRSKARRLAYYQSASEPVHPRVLWTVPDQRRAEQLTDVLSELPAPAERLFAVCLHAETIPFLAVEARS